MQKYQRVKILEIQTTYQLKANYFTLKNNNIFRLQSV